MQPIFNQLRDVLGRIFHGAFPDDADSPALLPQLLGMAPVAIDVGLEFSAPELFIGSWSSCMAATFVAMPEAPMNKHYGPVLWENKIWGAGKVAQVKSISKTFGEKKSSKGQFGPGILSTNSRHHATALRGGWYSHGLRDVGLGIAAMVIHGLGSMLTTHESCSEPQLRA